MTTKYYDRHNRRLVYIRRRATSDYWDDHWSSRDTEATVAGLQGKQRFFPATTAKYLPRGSRVVDGGCGMADKVYALQEGGFDAHGVDFATETIERARRQAPTLKLVAGDLRQLPYASASFDGYWSIGVIEHFYDGFGPIAAEIRRVLRDGGLLFLTFPAMTAVRRLKAALRAYPEWKPREGDERLESFYQFALTPEQVGRVFETEFGFDLVEAGARGGFRGLKEEAPRLMSLLKPVARARRPPLSWARSMIEKASSHSALLVLRKRG